MHRSLLFSTWQRMIVATCDCRYRVCRSTHFPVEHEEGKKESIPKKSAGKKGGKKKKTRQDRPARDKQGHRGASSREHLPRPASIIPNGKGKQSRQLKEGQTRRKQGKRAPDFHFLQSRCLLVTLTAAVTATLLLHLPDHPPATLPFLDPVNTICSQDSATMLVLAIAY